MPYEKVSAGTVLDIAELGHYESYLDEEQRGLLELDLRLPLSQEIIRELETRLKQAAVEEVSVTGTGSILKVYFRKGFPWLAVIAAIILGIIVLAILIIGWRLFREVVETIGPTGGWLMIAAVLGIVIVGAVALKKVRNG